LLSGKALKNQTAVEVFFFLSLLASASQLHRGIDLRGYLETIKASAAAGFLNPPYPQNMAQNGDYFQSPLTTMVLFPFACLPVLLTKFIFAGVATAFLLFLIRSLEVKNLATTSQFFLLLLFAHALSDIYVALNPLFLCLGLLWLFHSLNKHPYWGYQCGAGACFALAVFIRPIPVILTPFLFLASKKRKSLPWIIFWLVVGLGSTFLFFPDAFIWWKQWFLSLRLYTEAADLFSPAFQSPAAVFSKWLAHINLPMIFAKYLELSFSLMFFLMTFFWALKAEKTNLPDLAWACLLSCLYICFSRIWASGFFYCFPLLVFCLKQKRSVSFNILAVTYALLPQWLYPRALWNTLMSEWAIQGLVILGVLGWGMIRLQGLLRGTTPSHS